MKKQIPVKNSIHRELKGFANEHGIDLKDLTDAVLQKAIDDSLLDEVYADEFQQEDVDIEETKDELSDMVDEACDEVESEGKAKTTKERLSAVGEKLLKKLGIEAKDEDTDQKD